MAQRAKSLRAWKRPAINTIGNSFFPSATLKANSATKILLVTQTAYFVSLNQRKFYTIDDLKCVQVQKGQKMTLWAFVCFFKVFSMSLSGRYEEASLEVISQMAWSRYRYITILRIVWAAKQDFRYLYLKWFRASIWACIFAPPFGLNHAFDAKIFATGPLAFYWPFTWLKTYCTLFLNLTNIGIRLFFHHLYLF